MTIPTDPPVSDDGDVTDRTDVLRGSRAWQGVLAGGLAVLSAATITAFVGVGDPAAAGTYVTSVTRAVVVQPDGTQQAARIGDLVPRGGRLRTGQGGGARLTTAGRDLYVGAVSTVLVQDGLREALERGQVMVDSRSGPRLALATGAGTVSVRGGALARVERGVVLRVGVFDGAVSLQVQGRQATTTVPALYQVLTQYGALPGRPTALALQSDAWEQRLAADLTGADEQLNRLQVGLRGAEGALVLTAAPASLRRGSVDPDRGEQALSVALAQEARAAGGAEDNLVVVRTARREGGSWGVVAAIVRASVTDVSGRLDATLNNEPPGTLIAGPPAPGVVSPGGPTSGPPAGPTDGSSPTPSPSTSPTAGPTSPSPSPSTVEQVVKIVRDLLPTPLPSLSPLASPPAVP